MEELLGIFYIFFILMLCDLICTSNLQAKYVESLCEMCYTRKVLLFSGNHSHLVPVHREKMFKVSTLSLTQLVLARMQFSCCFDRISDANHECSHFYNI